MSSPIPFANLSSSQLQDLKNLEEKLSTDNSGNETIVIAYSQPK
jgi:hypothetical protein